MKGHRFRMSLSPAVLLACVLELGCAGDGGRADADADGSATAVSAESGSADGEEGTADGTATSTTGTEETGTDGTGSDETGSDATGTDETGTEDTGPGDVGSGATVVYVKKIADVTDFSAQTGLDLGTYGYYFPQFGQETPKSKRIARDNMRFNKPTWQKDWEWKVFEQCGGQFCNLFSPDAGVFDVLEGEEGIGVYSESEGNKWAFIKFSDGEGNSGSIVDESANGNSNNTVNHIRIGAGAPQEFCMSILTDNTAGDHDINDTLAARIGWYQDVDLETGTAHVPEEDLVYNGVPDLYVFKYSYMTDEDFIKIRLNGGEGSDPGFGGLMFDPCE